MIRVPFHLASYGDLEQIAVSNALRAGRLEGDGPNTAEAIAQIAKHLGHDRILLTTTGTHALELAFRTLDIGPGDEVVCPSFTFVTTANAVVQCGGRPVFCDVDPLTLTMDPQDLSRCLSKRTRAVVPVHYGGVACDMNGLSEALDGRSVYVVEDAAQALGARFHNQAAGTLGDLSVFSFHDTKNLSCGEGGALIVNDESLLLRATVIRDKGTDRAAFLRGEVDSYSWVDIGSSYLLCDLLAALLRVQVERMDEIGAVRERVWHQYYAALRDYDESGRITLSKVPTDSVSNYHTFWFLACDAENRGRLLRRLQAKGVDARSHFVPLHTSPFVISRWGRQRVLPITADVCGRLIRLPLHAELDESDTAFVIGTVVDELRL